MVTEKNGKKILVAMSGGVDSSAAALLLQEAGWECVGFNMRLWCGAPADGQGKSCGSSKDAEDARAVCEKIGIPFTVIDFTEAFDREVISRFVSTYERGETPNPCVDCNRCLKFGRLYEEMRAQDCDAIATGHYARIEQGRDGRWLLKRAADRKKDQSYVLYNLTQEQLAHTVLPLGGLSKPQVREQAEKCGLINAHKQESQDICFVPDGDYAAFIERRTGKQYKSGNFVLEDGTVIGRHRGMIHYTVGQRKGLGIAWSEPLYVLRKNVERNEVVLSDNAALFRETLTAREFNWVSVPVPEQPVHGTACVRYQGHETPCTATVEPDGRVTVRFEQPVRAITPGQSVVIYDGDIVLGGGIICG